MRKSFTGWHMTIILVAFFGVVMAVNFTMAFYAGHSFGGIVVENSYVASQQFNRWLDEARSESALGWQARVSRDARGRLIARIDGAPAQGRLEVVARHPLGRLPDRALDMVPDGKGGFRSAQALPDGRWTLRLDYRAAGRQWRREVAL